MKRLFVALMASGFCVTAAAQSTAPATDAANADSNKAKQETVQSTTQTQTKQMSGSGYHGAKPAGQAKKLSNEEKQQVMSGVAKSAKDQYRPITPPPAASGSKNAAKAAKPRMSDPEFQKEIQKQQRS